MKIYYHQKTEIEEFISQFNAQILPLSAWTHEAHLTVACWFLHQYSQAEAACYIRSGIITYNKAVGTANTPQKGYHETITVFWIKIISNYIETYKKDDLLVLCNDFLNSEYATRDYLLNFYSRELLFSAQARGFWTEPDKTNMY
jgi:hypothetical protein